ncbi:hypothetical protein Pan44_28230 [Caulifigura coniformis]|uniref:Uncharacterized protein n=1 Tax=Caulifigura coniformis TaxID=2527983 RepID=A0A517SF67_9PLAN|nr:hypothetical protein [Caulifigura coniformis]QDT54785.1 hypothetical protein Pan44_28230 [Caulifigura coniformis]
MNLDSQSHQLLRAYQRRRLFGVRSGDMVRVIGLRWLIMLLIGLAIYWMAVPTMPAIGHTTIGALLGRFAGDLAYFRSSRRIWPTIEQITDWQKIDELVGPYPASRE